MSITCAKCGIEKDPVEFHKSTKSKTGLQSYCRTCHRAYQVARQAGQAPGFHRYRNKAQNPAVVYGKVRKVAVKPRSSVVARFAVTASSFQPVVQVIGGTSSLTLDLEAARALRRDLDGILAGF